MHFGLSLTDGAVFMAAFSIGGPLLICVVTLLSLRAIEDEVEFMGDLRSRFQL
jgi:hypothetical protein